MYSIYRVIKRNWILFTSTLFVCFLVSLIAIAWQPLGAVRTEIFTTIAAENFGREGDATDAANYFSETIKGWLKNPSLLSEVEEQSGISNISLSAHPQERQNLVIDVTASSTEDSEATARVLLEVLAKRINAYNLETKASFKLIPQGMNTYQLATRSQFIYILGGLIAGAIGGLFLIFSKESLLGRLTFTSQLSDFTDSEPLLTLEPQSTQGHSTLIQLARNWQKPFVLAAVSKDAHQFMLQLIQNIKAHKLSATIVDGTVNQDLITYITTHSDVTFDSKLNSGEKKQIDEKGIDVMWLNPSSLSAESSLEIDSSSDFIIIYTVVPEGLSWLLHKHISQKVVLAELGKSEIQHLSFIDRLMPDSLPTIVLK